MVNRKCLKCGRFSYKSYYMTAGEKHYCFRCSACTRFEEDCICKRKQIRHGLLKTFL